MKHTLTVLLCFFFFSGVYSQILKKETILALKRDHVEALRESTFVSQINNCYDQKGAKFSLLGLAIKSKAQACFDYLLSQEKIRPNQACDNISPLMYAVKYDQIEMVKSLLAAGADPTAEYNKKSALTYAKRYKRTEILALLTTN